MTVPSLKRTHLSAVLALRLLKQVRRFPDLLCSCERAIAKTQKRTSLQDDSFETGVTQAEENIAEVRRDAAHDACEA